MFSHVTLKGPTRDMTQVEKDVIMIMTIIEKKTEVITEELEKHGYISIDKLIPSYDCLTFDLRQRRFDEHWKEVRRTLEEKLGLRVSGKPVHSYDVDKTGKIGILQMTFSIKS